MPLVFTENAADLDWDEVVELFRLAPLGDRNPLELKTVFANSIFKCFVFDDTKLVGAGRVLADGFYSAYLCDIVVLPSHQRKGIGKQIMERLVALSKSHEKIILYAVPGKEPFYEKFGFRRMTTAMAIFHDPAGAELRGYLMQDTGVKS